MSLSLLLLAILFGLLAFLFFYARWNYGKLDNLGFPLVKPHFLLGSDPQGYRKIQHLEDFKRFKKYGNIYGFFEGRSPQVHVCDPEMIRLILVKDYDHFNERQKFDFGNPVTNEVLDWQHEEKWKFLRSLMTPNFASHRIKDMSECLRELAEESVQDLASKVSGERITMEFRSFVTSLITKTIEKCYCGVRLENRVDPGNTFDILMKKLLREFSGYDIKHELVRAFPFLIKFHPIIPPEPLTQFRQLVLSLIASRQSTTSEKINLQHNFTDTLIELLSKSGSAEYKHLKITENSAVALALEFFLATFDSVSTPIVFLAYYLAANGEAQEKVLQEIDTVSEKYDGEIGYKASGELTYLQACFHEALRLAPAFFKVERKCTKDWSHKGYKIPKGVSVMIPVWAANRHPQYYDNPEEFIPERHLEKETKSNPYAFCTFGHGPKNCVGQRWAYEMGKIILANFLKVFRFEMREDSEIKWKEGSSFILKFEPIYLDIVKR